MHEINRALEMSASTDNTQSKQNTKTHHGAVRLCWVEYVDLLRRHDLLGDRVLGIAALTVLRHTAQIFGRWHISY